MYDDFEMAAIKEYIRKLIWQRNTRKKTLLQASIDTDVSSRTWAILEYISKELEEKEKFRT